MYRIHFTCVTNRLQLVSKPLVSKRLCIETTVNRPIDITFPLIEPGPTENEGQNVFSGHNKDEKAI